MFGTFLLIQRTRAQPPAPTRPHAHTPIQPSPVTVRILFPTAEDSPLMGGIVPLVVEVREPVSERGVYWTERLLIGVEGQVLLDTKQLSGGTYDNATQEMVYRVLTPLWTWGLPATDTFVWTQAQWVGVPLNEKNAPSYREGETTGTVDIAVDGSGTLTVFQKPTPNAQPTTNIRAGQTRRGGKTVPASQRRPRPDIKRSHDPAPGELTIYVSPGEFPGLPFYWCCPLKSDLR